MDDAHEWISGGEGGAKKTAKRIEGRLIGINDFNGLETWSATLGTEVSVPPAANIRLIPAAIHTGASAHILP